MTTSDQRLQEFIEATKAKGASDEGLAALLSRKGWPVSQVYAALGDYWARATGLEVPARVGRGESSRDAFLYLLAFSTLTTWACALGSLLFDLINHWLPDAVAPGNAIMLRSSLTWRMASLAVAFPIYLLVMRRIVRETAAEPERLESGVRKWLTWIALLLTAGSMIGDLIWFLDYFLTGELTPRFVLKCFVVFAITGAIFAYYTASLHSPKTDDVPPTVSRDFLFGAGASVAAIIVFCTAFLVAGTPGTQRQLEAERRRVNDLRQIAGAVFQYRAQNGAAPASLSEPLIRQRLGTKASSDPETKAPYEYRLTEGTKYQLCAGFSATATDAGSFWNHPAGRSCFELDATQTAPF
jgi:hypothetical protein